MTFLSRTVIIGVLFSLLALFVGEMHGMAFGAKESAIKEYFAKTSSENIGRHGNEEKAKKAAADSWKYLKRAHEHYMGLGAAALVMCILAGVLPGNATLRRTASTAVGFGALCYPFFWTLVSVKTASVGKHAAKESLELLAQAGAGAGFLGLLGVIAITLMWGIKKYE